MVAKDIMTRSVECIIPSSSITWTARRMKSLDVGFLPICEDDKLIGTVTDRDLVLRVLAEEKDPSTCAVRDIMNTDVHWCYEDQTTEEVTHYMAQKAIRRLLVLNRNKRLVGIISIGDLAKSGEHSKAGQAIDDIARAPSEAA